MGLSIKNWNRFQHFKDRRPPWIKLYRDLLDDMEWHELDPKASKMLVMLWLIASEHSDGELPDIKTIAFRLRISIAECKLLISKLSHWVKTDDINEISDRYQSVRPERETETESETESETDIRTQNNFDEVKEAYPKRGGGQRWQDAERFYNTRIQEGVTHQEILAGVLRYRDYCNQTGKTGTEYVQQAATFFGRNQGYKEPWTMPSIVQDIRQLSAPERVRMAMNKKDERIIDVQQVDVFDLTKLVR